MRPSYLGDHFCHRVPVTTAKQNRARRMARNKNKSLMRKGWLNLGFVVFHSTSFSALGFHTTSLENAGYFPWEDFAKPIVAFPREFAALLKGAVPFLPFLYNNCCLWSMFPQLKLLPFCCRNLLRPFLLRWPGLRM